MVDLDPAQPLDVFKNQLFSLTSVHPDRQKVLKSGIQLKPDFDLTKLKQGQVLMMMGNVGELLKEPTERTVFIEDMSDSQLAEALKIPAGLSNLGNTCYLSATLQCMRAIPELSLAMEKSNINKNADSHSGLVVSLRELFSQLAKSGDTVFPYAFVHLLRATIPRFNESTNAGYTQQDAEECWGELVSIMKQKVSGLDADNNTSATDKFVDQYMCGQMKISLKCNEAEESVTVTSEPFTKLTINIGAGVSTYMQSDLLAGLTQPIEKTSVSLGRTAMYTQTSRISRLPFYLVTNFVRFQWKASESVRAKILKRVKFPFDLDIADCCTPELVKMLAPARAHLKSLDDKRAEAKKQKVQPTESAVAKINENSEDLITTHNARAQLYAKLGIDASLANDIGANVSGWYELVAVLTHVGRTAESGHYVGWVKQGKNWFKYDDERVSPIAEEDITKLEGGGDWHSAYISLYRSKSLEDQA